MGSNDCKREKESMHGQQAGWLVSGYLPVCKGYSVFSPKLLFGFHVPSQVQGKVLGFMNECGKGKNKQTTF